MADKPDIDEYWDELKRQRDVANDLLDRISNELDYLRSRRDLCGDAYDVVIALEDILKEGKE